MLTRCLQHGSCLAHQGPKAFHNQIDSRIHLIFKVRSLLTPSGHSYPDQNFRFCSDASSRGSLRLSMAHYLRLNLFYHPFIYHVFYLSNHWDFMFIENFHYSANLICATWRDRKLRVANIFMCPIRV
jgi:hypothetical protein